MAPQHSKTIVEKFDAAERDIERAFKRFENYIGKAVANMATSPLSAELRLEAFLEGIRDCKEIEDLRKQIAIFLKSCKVEICNVNAGFLKFVQLHVNAENSELDRHFGISSKLDNVDKRASSDRNKKYPSENVGKGNMNNFFLMSRFELVLFQGLLTKKKMLAKPVLDARSSHCEVVVLSEDEEESTSANCESSKGEDFCSGSSMSTTL